jgi:hypothetical protein
VEFLEHLKTLPNAQALEVLRGLQSTREPMSVLTSAQGRLGATQRPSNHEAVRATASRISPGLEAELCTKCPLMYPQLDTLDLGVEMSFLNPLGLAEHFLPTTTNDQFPKCDHSSRTDIPNFPTASSNSDPQQEFSLGPRRMGLQISLWTDVPISNKLAESAVAYYLETEHPITGFFDADLFLHDLLNCRLSFCSRLLVSSLLHFSCVCRRYIYDQERC